MKVKLCRRVRPQLLEYQFDRHLNRKKFETISRKFEATSCHVGDASNGGAVDAGRFFLPKRVSLKIAIGENDYIGISPIDCIGFNNVVLCSNKRSL